MFEKKGSITLTVLAVGGAIGLAAWGVNKAVDAFKEQGIAESNEKVIKYNEKVKEKNVKILNKRKVEKVKKRKETEKGLQSEDPMERAKAAFDLLRRGKK